PTVILGLGVNCVHLNERFTAGKAQYYASAEYILELNYSYYAAPWLMLRPNLQHVINSGSSHVVDNALVLGLGSRITF
uniref:carbohydrate porin n=1 Tax=Brucella sp. CMUL 004 TaxID=1905695 RepID=UPI0011777666